MTKILFNFYIFILLFNCRKPKNKLNYQNNNQQKYANYNTGKSKNTKDEECQTKSGFTTVIYDAKYNILDYRNGYRIKVTEPFYKYSELIQEKEKIEIEIKEKDKKKYQQELKTWENQIFLIGEKFQKYQTSIKNKFITKNKNGSLLKKLDKNKLKNKKKDSGIKSKSYKQKNVGFLATGLAVALVLGLTAFIILIGLAGLGVARGIKFLRNYNGSVKSWSKLKSMLNTIEITGKMSDFLKLNKYNLIPLSNIEDFNSIFNDFQNHLVGYGYKSYIRNIIFNDSSGNQYLSLGFLFYEYSKICIETKYLILTLLESILVTNNNKKYQNIYDQYSKNQNFNNYIAKIEKKSKRYKLILKNDITRVFKINKKSYYAKYPKNLFKENRIGYLKKILQFIFKFICARDKLFRTVSKLFAYHFAIEFKILQNEIKNIQQKSKHEINETDEKENPMAYNLLKNKNDKFESVNELLKTESKIINNALENFDNKLKNEEKIDQVFKVEELKLLVRAKLD